MDENKNEIKVAAEVILVADAADMTMKDQEKQGVKCCEYIQYIVCALLLLLLVCLCVS